VETSRALQPDRAAVLRQVAADHVEDRGLAGAVRADEAEDLVLVQGERHVGDGADAAEPLRQPGHLEHRPDRSLLRRLALRSDAVAVSACSPMPLLAPCRKTERRMSSRSSSSAVGPGEAHLALLHEVRPGRDGERHVDGLLDQDDRAAGRVDLAHDLEQLADDRRARPSDSSSMMSSLGLATKAIPSASCCCSRRRGCRPSGPSAPAGAGTSQHLLGAGLDLGRVLVGEQPAPRP
jgi:hypothetical protein